QRLTCPPSFTLAVSASAEGQSMPTRFLHRPPALPSHAGMGEGGPLQPCGPFRRLWATTYDACYVASGYTSLTMGRTPGPRPDPTSLMPATTAHNGGRR